VKNSSTSLTKLTLQKFKRNSWGVFSFIFLCACTFLALFAYVLAPDDSKNANQMHLSIHSKSPGFKVKMLKIPYAEEEQNSFSEFFIGKKKILRWKFLFLIILFKMIYYELQNIMTKE